MPELTPVTPLGGYARAFGDTTLAEVADFALVSLAVPRGGDAAFAAAVQAAWGAAPPPPGEVATGDGATLFQSAAGQYFTLLPPSPGLAAPEAAQALGGIGYVTEQTDAWAALRLSGPLARPALERICMLDLDAFAPGVVARTMMEHLGVILICEQSDAFLLLSASSSARSFLHAVEISLKNVV